MQCRSQQQKVHVTVNAVMGPNVDESNDPGACPFATIPLAAAVPDRRGARHCRPAMQLLNVRLWPGVKDGYGADDRVWLMSDCPCCGLASDTQADGILCCPHPTLQALRSSTFAAIQGIIETLPVQHQRAAEQIVHMTKSSSMVTSDALRDVLKCRPVSN